MNRRAFLKFLGIGVPAAAVVATVAPKVETAVAAKLGEWNNFYSEGDPELMAAIESWKPSREYRLGEMVTLPEQSNIYFDKEFMQMLKAESLDNFKKVASNKKIPVYMDVKRNFFVYNTKS